MGQYSRDITLIYRKFIAVRELNLPTHGCINHCPRTPNSYFVWKCGFAAACYLNLTNG